MEDGNYGSEVKAERRDDLTKSYTKQLRDKGFVPSVVYGKIKGQLLGRKH